MTAVWPIDPHDPDPAIIAGAADLIRAGKLVAMPTETVYGLAANALDETAVRGIFNAKGRPSTNPLIVHVEDKESVKRVASEFPEKAQLLAEKFWPGPLSVVLPKHHSVPDIVTAGGPTVAVRCPDHAVARALIRAAGVPLAAPSANLSTELSPTRAEHVLKSMNGRIDAILDAGPCRVGIESTVVEINEYGATILRAGTLLKDIEKVMGISFEADHFVYGQLPKSPGLSTKHYSPRTKLLSFFDERSLKLILSKVPEKWRHAIIYIQGTEVRWIEQEHSIIVYLPDDANEVCKQLYVTLHRLDELRLEAIFIDNRRDLSSDLEWIAINDRIKRACANPTVPLQSPD